MSLFFRTLDLVKKLTLIGLAAEVPFLDNILAVAVVTFIANEVLSLVVDVKQLPKKLEIRLQRTQHAPNN